MSVKDVVVVPLDKTEPAQKLFKEWRRSGHDAEADVN
jgi:hypothetical protein